MTWSEHRKRVREFITPELRDRIDLHVTRYRKAHDEVGEAWITVDKRKVLGAGYYKWWMAFHKAHEETGEASQRDALLAVQVGNQPIRTFLPKTEQLVHDRGVYETQYFLASLHDYLDLSIDKALLSQNPIIKAFAMVDRRLGRRRLSSVVLDDSTPDIVKVFHALRMETMRASNNTSEGIRRPADGSPKPSR